MKVANDVVRFSLEIASLVCFGMFGWHVASGPWQWVLVVAFPAAAAMVWGRFMAPKSPRQLHDPLRLVVEAVYFSLAWLALAATGRVVAALVLAAITVVNLPLDRLLSRA